MAELKDNDYNLNIPLYVEKEIEDNLPTLEEAKEAVKISAEKAWETEEEFRKQLKNFELL